MVQSALSNHFRGKRDGALRALIARAPRVGEGLRVLDLGGRADYWQRIGFDWLAEQGARITLLNLSDSEFSQVADAPAGLFENVIGNACALDFADNSFDIAHANSVIEHVGMWHQMAAFAAETRRVASAYYVQTPNFWFPVDPHFWKLPLLHWLPRPTRAMLLKSFPLATAGRAKDTGQAYAYADSNVLLTKGQMRYLFPEAEVIAERVAALPKSYIAIYDGRAKAAQKLAQRAMRSMSDGEKKAIIHRAAKRLATRDTKDYLKYDNEGRALPPWLVFPDIAYCSIGWRMGSGEDYWHAFSDWYCSLADDQRSDYQEKYPEPESGAEAIPWTGFYKRKEDNG